MIYVSNFISTIMQLYIAYNLFTYTLGKIKLKKMQQICIFAGLAVVDSLAAIYIDKSTTILPLVLLMTFFVVALTYQGQLFIKFMLSMLLTAICALCEISAGMILVSLTHEGMNTITTSNQALYLFGVLLSSVLALFIVKLIGYFKHTQRVKLSMTLLFNLFLTSFASLSPLYIVGRFSYELVGLNNTIPVIIISVLLIGSNLVLFHFYEAHLGHEQQKIEYEFMSRQFKVQAKYYKKLVNEQETVNKTLHDVKNTLLAIEGSIRGGDHDGALRKINEICRNLNNRTKIYTSNIVVDTILNAKLMEAQHAGVDLKIISSPYSVSHVDVIDLGVILGNALDNAIEACRKITDSQTREIYAKILCMEDYISIVIENSVDKPVQIIDGMVASTKQQSFHGYGIKNIKALVEKYDGDVQLGYELNKFTINMLLRSGCDQINK